MGGPSERENKRAAILFAVLAVVAREGLGAVSIRSVAAEAEGASLDDLGGMAFRSDLMSLRHETQTTRLFRS